GLPVGRLKTGTPPRLAADSVDYAVMEEQPGDPTPVPFSFLTDSIDREQISCWITRTNSRTHQIVRENLQFAPMYTGRIEGKGPRYCPSLEDKVVRFQDRGQHTVFLEPEGIDSNVLYANGISTSLPVEAQNEFVRSIPGLEKAKIVQPGYAVEYTFVAPRVLRPNLEVDQYPGLFLAGQICGTSGYEEAAAQGLMAGLNAGLKLQKREPFILGRHEAYIGVLIDDLVVSDPSEPYRMFTSRAEHRLLLRHDTADRRLTPMAQKLGVVSQNRYGRMESRLARLAEAKEWLQKTPVPETSSTPSSPKRLVDLLRRTDTGIDSIQETLKLPQELGLSDEEWRILEADILYEGYVKRQQEWVEGSREREKASIPDGFDFQAVRGLRNEAKECLSRFQPATLGAAGRLAGISPSDVALMEVALRRENYL
ncbi:MAG: FAD-dependent oxidoreductase, partial [Planctomycetota bacterium]|nr:FAD-dependent oxidoreductase [Planctomycetota bacterium]